MRPSTTCAAALLLGITAASALAATTVPSCPAYPSIASSLSKCKTGTAFCESLLGRSATTVTHTYKTYTTTVPYTITEEEVVSTTTTTGHSTIPTFTSYSTSTIL